MKFSNNSKIIRNKNINFITQRHTNNYGLRILKMLLCIWVVYIHTCRESNTLLKHLFFYRKFHVPGFIIISFYFLFNNISKRDIDKAKQRFIRLLIPYFIIPIFIWLFNNISYKLTNYSIYGRVLKFKDLINQFIIGYIFHLIFWFHFVLLFLTLLFFIIGFIFKHNFLTIIQICGLVAYIFQYSGYNFIIFSQYKFIGIPLGNILELCPSSAIGFSFGAVNLINLLQKYRLKVFCICSIFLYLLFKYDIFINIKGFLYQGIMNTLGGMFLFIIFSLFPFEKLKNKFVISIIILFSNYTGGIYYFHILIKKVLRINIIKQRKFQGTSMIYIISYIICLIGKKIFGNTKLKYIFI